MNGNLTSEDLHDADLLTRVMARCSACEIALAVGALAFAIVAGLAAAPLG